MDFKPGDRVRPNAVFTSLCPSNLAAWSPGIVLTAEEAAKHLGRRFSRDRVSVVHDTKHLASEYYQWLPEHLELCEKQEAKPQAVRHACTCDLQSLLRRGCVCGGI